tara:strand:- start:25 stop:876 length:852 start_codon:yes stop_codon:yes gene_type:complete
MNKKLIKVALVGKTNAGKSTLINNLVGEEISISNKKINTTNQSIVGIVNKLNTQIIIFDTPGSNFMRSNLPVDKNFKISFWQAINEADIIVYMIDILKYDFKIIKNEVSKINEVNKLIIFVFNKVDLIQKNKALPYIDELKKIDEISNFFLISAKYNQGIKNLIKFLILNSYSGEWIYNNSEITDKSDIFITNECTRNAILKYLHKEIPYNISVINQQYKFLKNNDLKIKQTIKIDNIRYKSIIIGKKGNTIKRIREKSQKDIQKILKCKVHLYLQIVNEYDK